MIALDIAALDATKRLISETCLIFVLAPKLACDGLICASVLTVHMPLG